MPVTVYRAREIVTLDANCPLASAVAVLDERVLHVGTYQEVTEALRDTVFETDDRFLDDVLVPGFIEAHGHLYMDGALGHLAWTGFDDRPRPDGTVARGCTSITAVLERLREHAHQERETVVGYGFDPVFHDGRSLRREDLDQVSTTQGVLVVNASFHLAYANSALLRACGIDASSEDQGVLKDSHGEPTGELHETALYLVLGKVDVFGRDAEQSVRAGGELLRQAGVTAGSDLALVARGDTFDTYARVVNESSFPVRVFYSPHVEEMAKLMGRDELVTYLGELRGRDTARFGMGPLKWIADGSIQGFTGKLKWPGYCAGEDHGFLILSEDEVLEKVLPFHEAGFQLALHTNGDEATATVLRALERVLRRTARFDHRHRLEHCQMASRAMLRKMANLGVGANLFANHVYYWGDVHRTSTMGADKARRMDAAATALAEGVAISLHSDHPVTPVSPLFTMWCAVNRITRSGHVLGPAQRITALEALRAVTLGAAYLLRRDEELGSIEVGKFADFTVLDENPLTVDPLRIKDIDVVGTVVAGVAR
ncbi:MAG: amidohydrolase [Acidimicrobiales bacterium]